MEFENDYKTAIALLKQGKAPGNSEILKVISVATSGLVDFIKNRYFREYISLGGGKIKFVTGKTGSGKTHFLQLVSLAAAEQGFATVNFSAKDTWLHDFKDIYAEIFKKSDIMASIAKCADRIIEELGYDCNDIPENMSFADYLSSIGEFDALIKKEIRNQLRGKFLKNPLIDNNFAIACSLLAGGILGHPSLEGANRSLLLCWLSGSKDVKLTELRSLGLSPSKITKFNARHMLRSLAEVHKIAELPGIVVMIDDVDILTGASSLDTIRYTKLKREDAYESIRELIDEIDTLRGVMFFYAFDRQLIDNEASGIKSYQALWLRIQNEIVSGRFNSFTDIIDLDRFAIEAFGTKEIITLSEKVADCVNSLSGSANGINMEKAEEMLSSVSFAKTSLPRQVVLSTVNPVLISEYETEEEQYDRF